MKKFNFQQRIEDMQNSSQTRKVVEEYQKYVEPLVGKNIEDTEFYRNYLSKFDFRYTLQVSYEQENIFDWDLLIRLVAASFSSRYDLILSDRWKRNPQLNVEIALNIEIESEEKKILKSLHNLWSYQIQNLFEIYITEQMNLSLLKYKEEGGFVINDERNELYRQFNDKLYTLRNTLVSYEYLEFI